MNADRLRALLELRHDEAGRTVLPVLDTAAARVFGGQMLAQLIAAAAPAGAGKAVKSLHVLFPREARPQSQLYLELETVHEGRSLGSRRAEVWQDAQDGRRVVATASILLDRADEGHDYQLDVPLPVDPADAKPEAFAVVPGESRLISGVGLQDDRAGAAEFGFWMRCEDVPAQAVVAYVSDWPVIGTLLKAMPGVSERDAHASLQTGVVSHSIWFHQPFEAAQWLQVEVRGQRLAGGRGFGTGSVYTQSGALVASFAQESVIRKSVTGRTS
ncbi:MAG: acyl-CoA thioesterase [Actinomycetia bacterium]|nr:acyl-CoA thioesterase [Actinomycetes bacterium]